MLAMRAAVSGFSEVAAIDSTCERCNGVTETLLITRLTTIWSIRLSRSSWLRTGGSAVGSSSPIPCSAPTALVLTNALASLIAWRQAGVSRSVGLNSGSWSRASRCATWAAMLRDCNTKLWLCTTSWFADISCRMVGRPVTFALSTPIRTWVSDSYMGVSVRQTAMVSSPPAATDPAMVVRRRQSFRNRSMPSPPSGGA